MGRVFVRLRWLWSIAGVLLASLPAEAWVDLGHREDYRRDLARGGHVLDGSYVMNVGELHINITNHGLIGSQYSLPSSFADSPSGQWPAGTGEEYLWAAGLWVGAISNGLKLVSTGQYERELRPLPNPEDTIYEAIDRRVVQPPGDASVRGNPKYLGDGDDDHDGRLDEEILDGHDNDGDGLIDEDFGQAADQMMVCTMYDNTPLAREIYPDHTPLNIKVVQSTYAWSHEDADDFVGFEWNIKNIGAADLEYVYLGIFVDCDIGRRGRGDTGLDDLAGFWEGFVRSANGSFVPVGVAYMYDAALVDPLAGYFGVAVFDYSAQATPYMSEKHILVRSYQSFTGEASYQQGGDPTNDAERYDLLARRQRDRNTPEDRPNDFRFLLSVGPWRTLPASGSLTMRAAMVMGRGLDELIQNCAAAGLTCYGRYFDLSDEPVSGYAGRETKVCTEDFPVDEDGDSVLHTRKADWWDISCTGTLPQMGIRLIGRDDLFEDEDGRHCVYVNADNCLECERYVGQPCNETNLLGRSYRCGPGCTGQGGRETQFPWFFYGAQPPPSPGIRVWPRDRRVHVYWDDRSEQTLDYNSGMVDFESYRIYRVAHWDRPHGASEIHGPDSDLWEMIAEFDLVNDYYFDREINFVTHTDTLALGLNTGLEVVAYRPACLDDPAFDGLGAAMQQFVSRDSTGHYQQMPSLRDKYGNVLPGLESMIRWEGYPAVLDTFFLTTSRQADPARGIVGKHGVRFYEYVDEGLQNGFLYFYSVVATDHRLQAGRIVGYGRAGDPRASFQTATPSFAAQTAAEREKYGANIFVYPNPATRESLDEFQRMQPNADDPTGLRIVFSNLPNAHNRVSVFTLDGDLVTELDHDGTAGYGQLSWNLVSRSGQQIVSGIYLFVVQSDDNRFEDFVGKFVVIH